MGYPFENALLVRTADPWDERTIPNCGPIRIWRPVIISINTARYRAFSSNHIHILSRLLTDILRDYNIDYG